MFYQDNGISLILENKDGAIHQVNPKRNTCCIGDHTGINGILVLTIIQLSKRDGLVLYYW